MTKTGARVRTAKPVSRRREARRWIDEMCARYVHNLSIGSLRALDKAHADLERNDKALHREVCRLQDEDRRRECNALIAWQSRCETQLRRIKDSQAREAERQRLEQLAKDRSSEAFRRQSKRVLEIRRTLGLV